MAKIECAVFRVNITRDIASGIVTSEDWQDYLTGKGNRTYAPAQITRDRKTGVVIMEIWMRDGKYHRDDGPAYITRVARTGAIRSAYWFRDGVRIEPPPRPTTRKKSAPRNPGPQ